MACEESQVTTIELRKLGHIAYSCDIQECSGGHPEWHIKGDCLPLLNGNCQFTLQNGQVESIDKKWDLIIAHPPCTRLCSSGQRWLYYGSLEYRKNKIESQNEAIKFFMKFTEADCEHIAIENPVGIMSSLYRQPDCIYNPYDFEGETECKNTCLWLKGLSKLYPTQIITKDKRTNGIWKASFDGKQYAWNDPIVAKLRSKTPVGVAKAMAEQWTSYIETGKNIKDNHKRLF